MGKDKDIIKKLKEDMQKLLEDEKLDDAKMAEMQARLDTMSPDPYKNVNQNYEEWKKANQWQPTEPTTPPPPSPHVCDDPNAHFDEVAAKCICNHGYVLDAVTGKCIESVGIPPVPVGEKDLNGITKIYADKVSGLWVGSDHFKEEEFTRNYASGKPSENSYECEYKDSNKLENEEVTFYTQINGFKKEPDTLSIKLLGNKHSDGSKDKWLIHQVDTDGNSADNFQIEDPHPNNTDNHQKTLFEIGESIIGKPIGVKAITYILDGKRHAETWLSFPEDLTTPKNNWRKYIDIKDVVKDCKKGFLNATNGGALLRIDGTKKGSLPTTKFMSIREIVPELATGTGTGTGGPIIDPNPTPEPPPVTEPPKAGQVYDSNKEGAWNNGLARTVDKSDGDITANGKGLEMHASGNPKLEIDGKGTATLVCEPGHGRAYVFVRNYNGVLEEEIMFDANVENHTIQMRSRHNEAPDNHADDTYWEGNNFGGLSAKVSPVDVGLKIEKYHNVHIADQEKQLPTKLELNKWHKIKYTFNDSSDGKGIYQSLEVNGQKVIEQTTTKELEPFMFDKAKFLENSYLWLRMNNTKTAKLGIKNVKVTLT